MSTQAYRELTTIETALRAAIRQDAPTVTDLFRRYKLAGGVMNLSDIDREEKDLMKAEAKRPPLKVR